jgi:peptide/nickel transport system permease protein
MGRYLLKRLLATLPVLFLTSMVIFGLMRLLPGDPVMVIVGQTQAQMSAETLDEIRREHGLDRPLVVQYITWLGNVFTGDLGRSIQARQPVWDILRSRLLPTIQIGLMAWVLAIIIAVPIAIISATKPGSWQDNLGTIGALLGAAMPYFLLGGALIYFVGLRLKWLPASGYVPPGEDPVQSLRHSILPAVTLGVGLTAIIMRQARSSLLEILRLTYITAARAKGLGERRVILQHALKNAMLPVVTILGILLGNVLAGAVITETIFGIPGIGRLLVDSIYSRDYPVVQAIVLMIGAVVILSNLLVDVIYGYLDPRIRY